MSIALNPIVRGYHPADSGHADLAAATRHDRAGTRQAVDSPISDRPSASGRHLFYALSVLAVSAALLAFAGWVFFNFLASLGAQFESLDTMQLMRALSGA